MGAPFLPENAANGRKDAPPCYVGEIMLQFYRPALPGRAVLIPHDYFHDLFCKEALSLVENPYGEHHRPCLQRI